MRAAFFVMPGAAVLREAEATVSALLDLGLDLTLVQFWTEGYFPHEALSDGRLRFVTLADAGFPGFPRLPRRDYERACGADFDPIAINVHDFVRDQYPTTRGQIHVDSWHYQQYYAAAFRIGTMLDALRPDVAIVQGGSLAVQKLVRVKCQRRGIPVLGWETPFIPHHVLLDPVGMHVLPGHNKIDRDWPMTHSRPLTGDEAQRLHAFLTAWRRERMSKYAQGSDPAELRVLDDLLRRGTKIAFFPGQIPWDASVLTGPYGVAAYGPYLASIRAAMPPGWCLAYKVHPLDPRADQAEAAASERFLPVRAVSIHDLFARAAVIVTHSSNVGLEALMAGRPVVCLGAPHYARKGLTLDVEEPAELQATLERGATFAPPRQPLDRFLHYLIADYLIPIGDKARLRTRIEETRTDRSTLAALACFTDAYPAQAARHLDFVRDYNRQAFHNRAHHDIVECLSRDERYRPFITPAVIDAARDDCDTLRNGRRQVCTRLDGLRPDTRLRYALAAHLAPAGPRVLDFGCGVGYGSYLLSLVPDAHVDGVDASSQAIAFARQHWSAPMIAYESASAGDWRRPDTLLYDLVVSFDTLDQMPNAEQFFGMLWAALAPGGVLAVSAFNRAHFHLRDNPFHIHHFCPWELRDLMAGLPDVGWVRVLGQEHDGPIVEKTDTCFCVALAVKGGASASQSVARLERQLQTLVPFTVAPVVPDPPLVEGGARL